MRVIFFLVFLSSFVFATELLKVKTYKLQKDESREIIVKYGGVEKLFHFRWTLYKNDGLIVFSSYDTIVSQHVLFLNHNNQSFRVFLKPHGGYEHIRPYIIVKFVKFDFTKHKAIFEIWLYDKNQEVYLKYL